MVMEYMHNVMEKHHWDTLNDEQKFNLSLYVTFDYMKTVILNADATTRRSFVDSIRDFDFPSAFTNIYFEYSFWLFIWHNRKHWFVENLLITCQDLGLAFIQYQYDCADTEHMEDPREYKQCEILIRNMKIR